MNRLFNTKIVFRTLGALLLIESLFMLVPMATAYLYENSDLGAWIVTTVLTMLGGLLFLLVGRGAQKHVGEREGY